MTSVKIRNGTSAIPENEWMRAIVRLRGAILLLGVLVVLFAFRFPGQITLHPLLTLLGITAYISMVSVALLTQLRKRKNPD